MAVHTYSQPVTNQQLWQIFRVLGWEVVRCMRFSGLLLLFGLLLLPWFLFRMALDVPQSEFESSNFYPAYYVLTVVIGVVLSYESQKGIRAFLSTRPLTTTFTFAWLLGIQLVTVAATFIVANALVRFVYGVDWPWGRPLLWLVFFVTYARCAMWRLMVGRLWELFAAVGFGIVAIVGFAAFQGRGELDLDRSFSLIELAVVGVSIGASLAVGYRSFIAIRTTCGDMGSEARFAENYGEVDTALVKVGAGHVGKESLSKLATLKTKPAALDWIAWRQAGVAGVFMAVIAGCMGIAVQIAGTVDYMSFPPTFSEPHKLFEVTAVMFLMTCFVSGFGVGLITAVMLRSPGGLRQRTLSAFHGVRPISNKEYYRVLARAMFRYCVMTWIVVATLLSVLPLIALLTENPVVGEMDIQGRIVPVATVQVFSFGFEQNSFYSMLGPFSIVAWLLFGFLLTWSFASVSSAVFFFGNDRSVAIGVSITVGVLVASLFAGLAYPDYMQSIKKAVWLLSGLLALVTTLLAFCAAWRAQLVNWRQALGAFCVWAILAALVVNVVPQEGVFGAILLSSLAACGVAAGPVGLAASRHR